MKNPSPGVKDIITPTEAIDYFVLSRRKFYDLLKSDKQKDFLVFYKERKMIIRTAFAKYLEANPDLRRRWYSKNSAWRVKSYYPKVSG